MIEKGFLGIDESNHGRFPEFFVAYYSKDNSLTEKKGKKEIPKKRKRIDNRADYSPLLNNNYRFIEINYKQSLEIHKRFKEKVNNIVDCVKLVVISNFIDYFGNLEKVYVDGKLGLRRGVYVIRNIKEIIKPNNPKIEAGSDYDRRVEIVNRADEIANLLYHFNKGKNGYILNGEIMENLNNGNREVMQDILEELVIKPEIEKYASLLK